MPRGRGYTKVDLRHLLEDLRDAYPGGLEETILTELVANSLDAGASVIRLYADPAAATFRLLDDGRGMVWKELRQFHNLATSSKTRGAGIGFAGVGIKLALLAAREVVTESRRGKSHAASRWHLASAELAPYEQVPPPGFVTEHGTAVQLHLNHGLSPLVDAGYLEHVLRQHFEPLLDPSFASALAPLYPRGVRFEVNSRPLEMPRVARRPSARRLKCASSASARRPASATSSATHNRCPSTCVASPSARMERSSDAAGTGSASCRARLTASPASSRSRRSRRRSRSIRAISCAPARAVRSTCRTGARCRRRCRHSSRAGAMHATSSRTRAGRWRARWNAISSAYSTGSRTSSRCSRRWSSGSAEGSDASRSAAATASRAPCPHWPRRRQSQRRLRPRRTKGVRLPRRLQHRTMNRQRSA